MLYPGTPPTIKSIQNGTNNGNDHIIFGNYLCNQDTKKSLDLNEAEISTLNPSIKRFKWFFKCPLIFKYFLFSMPEKIEVTDSKNTRNTKNIALQKQKDDFAEKQEIACNTETVTYNLLAYLDACVSQLSNSVNWQNILINLSNRCRVVF